MKNKILIFFATAFLAAVSTACSVNEEGIMGSFPYLEVELETKNLTKTASSDAIAINTNRSVSVSIVSDQGVWLTAVVEGDQLVLTWKENTLETKRTATITLSTSNSLVTKTISVTQDASGELTFDGDLILRSKEEIAANTYTKTTGDLIIGDVTSIVSKASGSSVSVDLDGKVLKASPSDISDSDIAALVEQIHMIGGGALAVVNTKATKLPVEIISQNHVTKVSFDHNAMKVLPSADVMESLGLTELSVEGNDLTDISPLAGCSTIVVLDISGNDVYDLDPIKEMDGLQTVVMDDLPISAPQLEVFRELCDNLEVIADEVRPEASPLPVFGSLEATPLSDTQVQLTAYIDENASGITKAGFYIGNKRALAQQEWHDAEYSDGVISMLYDVETLDNVIYYVRAYAENATGGDYSKAGFFGSLTSEEDIYIKTEEDLQKFYDDTYSHVNGSVFVGRTYESGSSGVKLDDGKYQMYFRTTDMSDLSKLAQLVYVRDGLYIGNVGLKDLKYIAHIEGMQTLWLRANELMRVPELAAAQTLNYLDVSMNKLSDIAFLDNLPALESLYLGSSDKPEAETNDIGVIDGLSKYTNLKHIDLSGLPLHQWQVDDLKAMMPETEIVFTSAGRDPHIPTVKAERVVRTESTVTMKATVISKGKSDIVEYGFYYGKDTESLEKITVEQSSISVGETFSHTVDVQDTDIYYWYPYAVNAQGETRCALNEFTLAYEDLSADMTANSYMIFAPGKYKFNATVKGNSSESIGSPVSAEVIWQFQNPEELCTGLISSVDMNDGYVEFEVEADATYGNALIAVKDDSGTILWSWHIWICDFDLTQTMQKYNNGEYILMDRNLGASLSIFNTSQEKNLAAGTLYQWGRKDPMTVATITHTRAAFMNPDESHAEPTAFVADYWWTNEWDYSYWSPDMKTMYDPCPPGWRVANPEPYHNIGRSSEYITDLGYSIYAGYYYPFGYYYDSNFNYFNSNYESYIWTSYHNQYSGNCPTVFYYYYYNESNFSWNVNDGSRYNTDAYAVRCMKEEGFSVSTDAVKAYAESAILTGSVTITDDVFVTERGFVWSGSNGLPTFNEDNKVECGSGDGSFSVEISELTPGVDYFVRAYAIADGIVRYGGTIQFRTANSGRGDDFTEDDYVWE